LTAWLIAKEVVLIMYRLLEGAQNSISRSLMILALELPGGTSVIADEWGKILMASTMVLVLVVDLVIGI